MYLKIHNVRGKKIVAACDKDLIGKIISDGNVTLDLNRYASFYKGDIASDSALAKELKSFDSANLVGKKVVSVVVSVGLVKQSNVTYINDIPHIQLYKL